MYRTLTNMKKQIDVLQEIMECLTRCVEDNKGVGLGLGHGLLKGEAMGGLDTEGLVNMDRSGMGHYNGLPAMNLIKGKANQGLGLSFGPQPMGQLNTRRQAVPCMEET